jgi:ribosomal protein L20A (L18A)
VAVKWDEYGWCLGEVQGVYDRFDRSSANKSEPVRFHQLFYEPGDEEWHDLSALIAEGRAKVVEPDVAATLLRKSDEIVTSQTRVMVYHEAAPGVVAGWYEGRIVSVRKEPSGVTSGTQGQQVRPGALRHLVAYDAGDRHWHELSRCQWKALDGKGTGKSKEALLAPSRTLSKVGDDAAVRERLAEAAARRQEERKVEVAARADEAEDEEAERARRAVDKLAAVLGSTASVRRTCIAIEAVINECIPPEGYARKVRSLATNLANNERLRVRVRSGEVTASQLVHMSADELAPDTLKRQRAESKEAFFRERTLEDVDTGQVSVYGTSLSPKAAKAAREG